MKRATITCLMSLALIAGCATPSSRIEGQWIDPGYAGRSLRDATVLIWCRAPDPTLARICEDHLARNLIDVGARPTVADPALNTTDGPSALAQAARRAGAQAALISTLAFTANPVYAPRSTLGIGFGVGRGVGIGMTGGFAIPLGGMPVPTPALAAHTSLVDTGSGAEVWSIRASRPAGEDLSVQAAALSANAIENLRRAGVFEPLKP